MKSSVLIAAAILGTLTLCSFAPYRPGAAPCQGFMTADLNVQGPLIAYDIARLDGIPGDPAVIADRGGYVMYYGAVKGDFTDTDTVRIFRASSADGVDWARRTSPVLTPGLAPAWDSVKVETPYVLRTPDGKWAMYYSGSGRKASELGFAIGLARSDDGRKWRKAGAPVLLPDTDELSLIGPSVHYDAKKKKYVMWYAAINERYGIDIRRAESRNGLVWRRTENVLAMDIERKRSDDAGIMGPDVIATPRGYEMVYNALRGSSAHNATQSIWHAVSTDGVKWTKTPYAIAKIRKGSPWMATEIGSQSWVFDGKSYKMWFVGTTTDYASTWNNGIGRVEMAGCKN